MSDEEMTGPEPEEAKGPGPDEPVPPDEPVTPAGAGWADRAAAVARAHPNRTVFLVGAILFAAGLVGVIGTQVGSERVAEFVGESVSSPTPENAGTRIGPVPSQPVQPYIDSKRSLLSERADSDPEISTLALVVFTSYRSADEVRAFLNVRNLSALAVQARVPVAGAKPLHIPLAARSLAEAAVAPSGEMKSELEVLEAIKADVEVEQYERIYGRELELHREAMNILNQPSPATLFGVVTYASYADLRQVATATEVRYIDLPVDPTVALQDATFAALVPEDVDKATFTSR